jgi:hypothetical protein
MVVTMVMVTAYCYGRDTHNASGEKGPSWRYSNTGGASAGVRHRPTRKQGLQGLRFALGGVGQWADSPVSAGLCGIERNWKGANLGAYWVCRFAPWPHENGQGRKLNAGEGLRLICRLNCRNRPTSEPDSVTVEGSVLAGACDRSWSKKGKTVRVCRSAMNTV